MAKLTKQEIKNHNKIMDLVHSDKPLTFDEKWDILENYHEGSTNINSAAGAFFTPVMLSRDFSLEIIGDTIVDLCAGIGCLSFFAANFYDRERIPERLVCVELNQEYVEIGKRIVPEAEWVTMDVLSYEPDIIFDQAISNPPFGKIKTSDANVGKYTGAEFEYKVITKASEISHYGTFILPQLSSGFKYSGNRHYERSPNPKYNKFESETGFTIEPGLGIDTEIYINDWKGVSPRTEIGTIYFTEKFQ